VALRSRLRWAHLVAILALALLSACQADNGQLYPGVEYSHLRRDSNSAWITVAWTDGSTHRREAGRFEVSCTRRLIRRLGEGPSGWNASLRWAFEPEVVQLVCGK
jgi:hypothetical protein